MKQHSLQILGDYSEFYAQQVQRLLQLGLDICGLEVSHLEFRTDTLAIGSERDNFINQTDSTCPSECI
jgi:hypothetical protein